MVVRVTRGGSLMAVLVASRDSLPEIPLLVRLLTERAPGFCSLHLSVNAGRNNVILGRESRLLYGAEAVYETLLGLTFEIPPLSFFQVNPAQTERLYQTAIDFAALTPPIPSWTLTRARVPSPFAWRGTRGVSSALKLCRRRWREPGATPGRNQIANAEFHTAAVETLLPRLVKNGLRPDVIVLDPPRKGVEPAVVEAVLAASPAAWYT